MAAEATLDGGVHLVVPASTDSLAIARQVVAALGDSLELDETDVADIKLLVSEACGNAVRHAYKAADGSGTSDNEAQPVEISVEGTGEIVVVTVRDQGTGFAPAVSNGETLGLGIPLMATIADRLELRARESGGVELRAEIGVGPGRRDRRRELDVDGDEPRPSTASLGQEAALMTVRGAISLRPILGRMIGICAARVGLTIDQLADGLIISDAVSAGRAWDDETQLMLTEANDYAELAIGPLPDGAGRELIEGLEVPGVGSIAKLASEVSVDVRQASNGNGAGEYVTLTVRGSVPR